MHIFVCIKDEKREGNVSSMPLASPDTYQCRILKIDQSMKIGCNIPLLCISDWSVHTLCCWIHHNKTRRLKMDWEGNKRKQKVTC